MNGQLVVGKFRRPRLFAYDGNRRTHASAWWGTVGARPRGVGGVAFALGGGVASAWCGAGEGPSAWCGLGDGASPWVWGGGVRPCLGVLCVWGRASAWCGERVRVVSV